MERKIILDSQLSSSSHLGQNQTAKHGRWSAKSSWCAANDTNPAYLTVDLLQSMSITGISVKGDGLNDNSVTMFKLQYSFDGQNFKFIVTDDGRTGRVSLLKVIPLKVFLTCGF